MGLDLSGRVAVVAGEAEVAKAWAAFFTGTCIGMNVGGTRCI